MKLLGTVVIHAYFIGLDEKISQYRSKCLSTVRLTIRFLQLKR